MRFLALAVVACFLTASLAADRQLRRLARAVVLKVDYPNKPIDPDEWDPAFAQVDYRLAMVQALYSPLLDFDEKSQLRAGWAKSFSWTDARTLTLILRQDKQLSDGRVLQADDVIWSLKRLAFLQQSTQAFFVEQFCFKSRLRDMNDACPGLVGAGDRVSIQTKDRFPFLPKLLAAIETSIVPRAAYRREAPGKLDHSKGSGPYRFSGWEGTKLILKANRQHFNFDESMPGTLEFIPSVNATVAMLSEAFRLGEIDLIPTFSSLNVLDFDVLAHQLEKESNTRRTLPMGLGLLYFSEQAFAELNSAVRQLLVLRLQAATESCLKAARQDQLRQPTIVLIPATGIGMLSRDEMDLLHIIRARHKPPTLPRTIRIHFPQLIASQLEPCLKDELVDLPVVFNTSAKETADLMFTGIDMSTYEEIAAARSLISSSFLDPFPLGRREWLDTYMAAFDNEKRTALLKSAHLRAIWENPSVIPLWNYETGALIRKPWILNASPLNILNPFHQIRYVEP